MSLLDGQYQFGSLLFGEGSPYGIRRIEGLESLNVRSGDRALPRGHGSVPGPHFAAAKDVILELVVKGSGVDADSRAANLAERMAALRAAFTIEESPTLLMWKRPGMPERQVALAPMQFPDVEEAATVDRVAFPRIAFTAADPRIYSTESHNTLVGKFTPTGSSSDYPGDYPKDFPAGAGDGIAVNTGNGNAYPLIQCFGPTDAGDVTSVTIRNLTTGQEMTVATDITTGQILAIDNLAHVTGSGEQVVGLDGASRYGSWVQPRIPFALPPGTSVIRYETEGTSTATVAVLTWRDTWL